MDDTQVIETVKAAAMERLSQNDDSHGYAHAERVAYWAGRIIEREGGNRRVIVPACYMHDWCAKGGLAYHVSEEAMSQVTGALHKMEFPGWLIPEVVDVVRHHDDYDWSGEGPELSLELQIMQDADNLDALGARGLARCFHTTGHYGRPLGTLEELRGTGEEYRLETLTSALKHIRLKILRLKDHMNTEYGKELAKPLHKFIEVFLYQLEMEWGMGR